MDIWCNNVIIKSKRRHHNVVLMWQWHYCVVCPLGLSTLVQATACCLFGAKLTLISKLQWNSNCNVRIFVNGNAFEYVFGKMSTILFGPQSVKTRPNGMLSLRKASITYANCMLSNCTNANSYLCSIKPISETKIELINLKEKGQSFKKILTLKQMLVIDIFYYFISCFQINVMECFWW